MAGFLTAATLIGAGVSAYSGMKASSASKSANSKASAEAAGAAARSRADIANGVSTARTDIQPYADVGGSANRELAYRMGLDQPKTPTPTTYALGQTNDPIWEQVLKGSELTPEWVNAMGGDGWNVSAKTEAIYKGLSAKYQALKAEQGDTYKGQGQKGGLNDNYDMASYKKDPGYTPMTPLAFGEEQYKKDPTYTPMTSLDFGMDKYKNDPGYTPMTSLDFGMDKYKEDPGYTPMVNSLEDLQATPGYQFQYDQGMQGVNNSAAAKGSLLSGRQLKDVNNYAQGQAATGFQAAWDRSQNAYQNAFNRNTSNYKSSQDAYNTAFNRNTSNFNNSRANYMDAFNRNTSNYQQSQGAYQNAYNRDTTNRNNEFNRLQSIANNGQTASTNQGGYSMTGAANMANIATGAGNTQVGLSLAQGQNNANSATQTGNSINGALGAFGGMGGSGSSLSSMFSSGGATNAPNISNTQSLGNSNMWSQNSMFPNSMKTFGG